MFENKEKARRQLVRNEEAQVSRVKMKIAASAGSQLGTIESIKLGTNEESIRLE